MMLVLSPFDYNCSVDLHSFPFIITRVLILWPAHSKLWNNNKKIPHDLLTHTYITTESKYNQTN